MCFMVCVPRTTHLNQLTKCMQDQSKGSQALAAPSISRVPHLGTRVAHSSVSHLGIQEGTDD
jgi:hypothetical protein